MLRLALHYGSPSLAEWSQSAVAYDGEEANPRSDDSGEFAGVAASPLRCDEMGGMSLEGLPNPDLLREYALRCRRAAKVEANLKKRQLLARHARAFGHLAEAVERKRPLAVSMIRDVIASYERILPKSGNAEALMEQRDNCFAGQAALHRVRLWRQKAEECRIAGEQMMFRDTRAIYFRLADDYEIMARREEERVAIATKRRQRGSRSAS